MGSPQAPTMANIFMDYFEHKVIPILNELGVKTWLRYVNDTFIFIDEKADLNKILKTVNGFHKNLKFTYEKEEGGMIPFLDVLVKRTNEFQTREDIFP